MSGLHRLETNLSPLKWCWIVVWLTVCMEPSVENSSPVGVSVDVPPRLSTPVMEATTKRELNSNREESEELAGAQIVLLYTSKKEGHDRGIMQRMRTKKEAEKLAEELYQRLMDGDDFGTLANIYSEHPVGRLKGGTLGEFDVNGEDSSLKEMLMSLRVGEISKPKPFDGGYRIVKRGSPIHVSLWHILISHAEASNKRPFVSRTKEEARKRAEMIVRKLKDGESFENLALAYSDCPSGKRAKGYLGKFNKGRLAFPFEKVAFELKDNEVSGVVETEFGFHIILRLDRTHGLY